MSIGLSLNYILRSRRNGTYILINKEKSLEFSISQKFFNFLYMYKDGNVQIDIMLEYLLENGISTDDIKECLDKEEFKDLFVEVDYHKEKQLSIYKSLLLSSFLLYTEYTPRRIDFLITRHCNLACKHCFENSSPLISTKIIPLDVLVDGFRQMDYLNIETLKITGGEPLAHPDIHHILEELSEKRFQTIILTNGVLLTEKLIQIISKAHIKLGISLDGISARSHDCIRGKGTFDVVVKNIRKLKEHKCHFCITISINKNNYTEIEPFVEFALNELGAKEILINQLKPLGRAKNNGSIFLSESEYKPVLLLVDKLNVVYNDKIKISDDAYIGEEPIINNAPLSISSNSPLVCAAGNSLLTIDENLDVYPCVYAHGDSNFVIGNLANESLIELWQSKKWDLFRGKVTLKDIPGCKTCNQSNICGMKNCRLKPVYNGQDFFSHVDYCTHSKPNK